MYFKDENSINHPPRIHRNPRQPKEKKILFFVHLEKEKIKRRKRKSEKCFKEKRTPAFSTKIKIKKKIRKKKTPLIISPTKKYSTVITTNNQTTPKYPTPY